MIDRRFDLVIIGHLTIDLMKYGVEERKQIGGPPAYAMLGPKLGLKNVGIVSRIGKDFPQEYYNELIDSGLNLDGVIRNEETTQFINVYDQDGNRTQSVGAVANSLSCFDVPKSYWNTKWMHISPVLGETDLSLIKEAKAHDVKVSVDAQGFVRKRSAIDHTITGCDWTNFPNVASEIDVLKADIDEVTRIARTSTYQEAAKTILTMGCPLILITQGQKGSFLYQESYSAVIPAISPNRVVDHTGSGDVFAISFLAEYQRTHRPLWSAFFASSSASFNVETPGPTNFPSYQKVVSRLRNYLSHTKNRHYIKLLLNESGPTDCPL
ncbi:MAG: carbohydrate kinase family protein [Candidatus Thorarchaeota archaeon]